MRGPAHEMLARGAKFAGTAYFQGRLYDLGRFPGAVASPRATDRIIGELYRLRTPAILLAALDSYEGKQFHREKVTIFTAEGNRVASWIYLLNREAKNRKQIPSGDYAAYLRRR